MEGVMKLALILETDWRNDKNDQMIAEVLRVLNRTNAWPGPNAGSVTWAAPLPGAGRPTKFSVTCEHSNVNAPAIIL